jgi:hypothetical protein
MVTTQTIVVWEVKDFHNHFSTKTKEEMASMERVVHIKR